MASHKTVHYLIALLKAYGINSIVASPGTQNSTFNFLVQEDKDFNCYSVIDERSAVYVAIGMANELNKPVAITCTGATAARNYMSGLTEAYYSETPIVACTFYDPWTHKYNIAPQYTDRSVSQNDIKAISVTLPEIKDDKDKINVLLEINAALSLAKYNHMPVHINCPNIYDYNQELPTDIWTTEYHYEKFSELKSELKNKKVAVHIGQHKKFTKEEECALSEFAKSYKIPVICDHSSNYQGENKVLIAQLRYIVNADIRPDIIIDIGGISGVYNKCGIFNNAVLWRITQNYKYSARMNRPLRKLLIGLEKNIFNELKNDEPANFDFFGIINSRISEIKYPDFPLSTTLISQELAKHIPNNSILHLAILSALDGMNLFNLSKTVDVLCNLGGFGIDGPLSTAVGQSLVNKNKKVFLLTGDLAFFYDMNILGNRHIDKNLRIILVNNNEGAAMRFNPIMEKVWGEKQKVLVTAAGHNKNGAKSWAEANGFKYIFADTKESLSKQMEDFCKKDYNAPVIFEVITTIENDKQARIPTPPNNTAISQIPKTVKLSNMEKVFSVRNEYSGGKKYKAVNLMGVRIKLKVKPKEEK